MNRRQKQLLGYLLAAGGAICVLPALLRGDGYDLSLLYVILPMICLLVGFFCALRCRFQWSFPVGTLCLSVPTVALYYGISALPCAALMGAAAMAGTLCGSATRYLVRISALI